MSMICDWCGRKFGGKVFWGAGMLFPRSYCSRRCLFQAEKTKN